MMPDSAVKASKKPSIAVFIGLSPMWPRERYGLAMWPLPA